jgi:hypothetical protein
VISGSASGVGSAADVSGSGVGSVTTGGGSVELGAGLDRPGTVTGGPADADTVVELAVLLLGGAAWFDVAAHAASTAQASAAATALPVSVRRTVMSLTVPANAYYCCDDAQ